MNDHTKTLFYMDLDSDALKCKRQRKYCVGYNEKTNTPHRDSPSKPIINNKYVQIR